MQGNMQLNMPGKMQPTSDIKIDQAFQQLGINLPQQLTRNQQGPTNFQQTQLPVTSSQNLVTSSQNPVALSEQASQAKEELEVLVATGKTQDFLKKQLTLQELNCLSEKDLLKFYKIYQTNLALRVNESFSKMAVQGYTKLVSWLLPVKDKDKLYNDLRNDYILMNELDRWTGWFSLKMGSLMSLVSVSLITVSNIEFSDKINGEGDNRSTDIRENITPPPEGTRNDNITTSH